MAACYLWECEVQTAECAHQCLVPLSISYPVLRNPGLQFYRTIPQKQALPWHASEHVLSPQLKGHLLHEALLLSVIFLSTTQSIL